MLPGTKLPRSIPPQFDMVLYADVEDDGMGSRRRVYRCDQLDPDYIMKDRFLVTKDVQPMELAPLVFKIRKPMLPIPESIREKKLNHCPE